jgi:hypothetical protein
MMNATPSEGAFQTERSGSVAGFRVLIIRMLINRQALPQRGRQDGG